MEIETAPRPRAATPRGRLVLLLALLGPVTLFVLLPIGLGLDRYVMTGDSMSGSIDRGSLVYERVVPLSDIHEGDIVTFERPGRQALVTHRVVDVRPDGMVTQGDAEPAIDLWVLPPDTATISRVEYVIPWVGWAYLIFFGPWGWVLTICSGVALVALTRRRVRRPKLVDGGAPGHQPAGSDVTEMVPTAGPAGTERADA